MTGARLVAIMCLAEVLGMAGFANFVALIPYFIGEWDLSYTAAGWLGGIYLAGYMAAVPVLVTLTDRIDARRIYVGGTIVGALASLAFPLIADGFWSALALRALAGVGLAGTYMPGLKILQERLRGPRATRGFAFYTACFGVGTSLSFFYTGEAAAVWGWQAAFAGSAVGAILSVVLVIATVRAAPAPAHSPPPPARLLDFRPVFANRRAMGYVIAYGAHAWELFGQRNWIVAFLAFSMATTGTEPGWVLSATVVATLVGLAGVPASIIGNEAAMRIGRVKVAAAVGLASAALALVIGFSGSLPYAVVVAAFLLFGILNYGDSAAITAGTVISAAPGQAGATMAVHSFAGFLGGFVGSLLFGVILDAAGGATTSLAWGLAFGSLGIAAIAGPVALHLLSRESADGPHHRR